MNRPRVPGPAFAALALLLGACGADVSDGKTFQRWAQDVAEIPIGDEPRASGPPLTIEVVDSASSGEAGLREAIAPAARAAVRVVEDAVAPAGRPLLRGEYAAQIGSFSSEAAARAAWAAYVAREPRALGSLQPRIERVEVGSRALVRLKAGPFVTADAAAATCARVGVADAWCAKATYEGAPL